MRNFICKLTSLCWLRAYGSDALSFFHGQLSNDLQKLNDSQLQFNAYCNPKGRMLCLFEVRRSRDELYLQSPCELQDILLNRLRMYVLRSDVKIEPQLVDNIGVVGSKAESLLADQFVDLPNKVQELKTDCGMTIVKQHTSDFPRYQVSGDSDVLGLLWKKLSANLTAVDEAAWWHQAILAGIPRVLSVTCEAFIPQMINLDLLNGISLTKGCYPGQEIVARMRYLGKLKQRMQRLHGVDVRTMPQPGDKISATERNVGTVVDAQADGEGGWDALAVLQLDLPADTRLELSNGAQPSVRPPPYPLGTKEQKQA